MSAFVDQAARSEHPPDAARPQPQHSDPTIAGTKQRGQTGAVQSSARQRAVQPVGVEMRNVNYRFTDTVAVLLRHLSGELKPTRPGEAPVIDDLHSFVIAVSSAEGVISTSAMSQILNEYVFAAPDAPLKKLVVSSDKQDLKVKGVLHDNGDASFEMTGEVSAASDGRVRVHTKKVKAFHLPAKGVLDLLGVDVSDLIKSNKVQGVSFGGNDLYLDLQQILPPPTLQGGVTDVRVEGDQIVLVFGKAVGHQRASASKGMANYIALHGGTLRFGKLTMNDTDLELIDSTPRDPFDFFIARYKEQLTAGDIRQTSRGGLLVSMPDFNKLKARASTLARRK